MSMRLIYVFLLTLMLAMPIQAQSLFAGGQPKRVTLNQQQSVQRVKQPSRAVSTHTKSGKKAVSLEGDDPPTFNQQQSVQRVKQLSRAVSTQTRSGRKVVARQDTARYVALTKRFGWYYGIGERLTKEEARRLPCYYQMTDKDSQGRFTHIEAVNGMGRPTTAHDMSNYLISRGNASRRQVALKWQELLQTVVQWHLWSAGDGKHLGMESGYDEQGNLIYSLILVPLAGDVVMAHYTDGFGEPISLLTGEDSPRYVQITQDRSGYDRQIIYLDEEGSNKRNLDGAYMLKQDYDSAGNVIRALSCLPNGTPVKDDWGNCGWMATYDDWGQMLSNTSIDERMKPVRPKRRFKNSVDVISTRFEYDRHRRVSECYLNEKGEKDTTSTGVNCRRWRYDPHGNVLGVMTCDTAGRLCNDYNGVAQTLRTYDKTGKVLSMTTLDKDSLYANDDYADDLEGACLIMRQNAWRTTTGNDTVPIVRTFVQGNTTTVFYYKDGFIIQTCVDNQGRFVKRATYTLDWQPKDIDDRYLTTSSYRKQGTQQIEETTAYSLNLGTPTGPDTIRVITATDTARHTRLVQTFRGDTLLSTFGQTLDNDLQSVTGQFGYDALGHRARSHLADALYYRVKLGTTYRGETSYMMGRNEYDEPSYVIDSEAYYGNVYCTRSRSHFLDENDKEIDDMTQFKQSLPRAYCVEVLNRRAYDLGLRSGDMIVRYGDYCYPQPKADEWRERGRLQLETYLKRDTVKTLLVLRYMPASHAHQVVELILPAGTPGELGFLIQTVYYTKREVKRYQDAVQQHLQQQGIDLASFAAPATHGGKKVCIVRPYKVSTKAMTSWRLGLQEDVIVLGLLSKSRDGTSTFERMDNFQSMWNLWDVDCDSMTVFYTANGRDMSCVTFACGFGAVTISEMSLPEHEFALLSRLAGTITLPTGQGIQMPGLDPDSVMSHLREHAPSALFTHLSSGDPAIESLAGHIAGTFALTVQGVDKLVVDKDTTVDDARIVKDYLARLDFVGYQKLVIDDNVIYQHSTTRTFIINGGNSLMIIKCR